MSGYSSANDLRPLFKCCFDAPIGLKKERESYEKIAMSLGLTAGNIFFLSDVAAELDADSDSVIAAHQREIDILAANGG